MKTREELKNLAKADIRNNYCNCVLTFFLCKALPYALSSSLAYVYLVYGNYLSFCVFLFVTMPLLVGISGYFLKFGGNEEISGTYAIENTFNSGYLRKLGGMAWSLLWTFLWGLLFVIPGIIKWFSYAMTPYILADCPDVEPTEALKISMRIMDGRKFDLFTLKLSFLLWDILGVMFFFIPYILWVGPYKHAVYAEYYKDRIRESIEKGIISEEELRGKSAI